MAGAVVGGIRRFGPVVGQDGNTLTMILNEYRLMPWQKEGQEMILKYMEDFFVGEGSALPPDFVPQQSK